MEMIRPKSWTHPTSDKPKDLFGKKNVLDPGMQRVGALWDPACKNPYADNTLVLNDPSVYGAVRASNKHAIAELIHCCPSPGMDSSRFPLKRGDHYDATKILETEGA